MKVVLLAAMLLFAGVLYGWPEDYVGLHKSVLIADWGAPTRITSDGLGGQVFVYEEVTEGVYEEEGETRYDPNTNWIKKSPNRMVESRRVEQYQFFVNKKGIIYRWMQTQ